MLIELTEEEAKRFGLLVCESCGHPENNHFDFDNKPCAHCLKGDCKGYVARSRVGRIVELSPEARWEKAQQDAEQALKDIGVEDADAGCVGCGKPANYRLMLPGGYFAAVCEGSPACEMKARKLWEMKPLFVTHDKKYGTRQAWHCEQDAHHEQRRDPAQIDVVEYIPKGLSMVDWRERHRHAVLERKTYHERFVEMEKQYERLRVMFLECWHCKAALEEPDEPAHCTDCGVTDEEYIDWEEWLYKGSLKTVKVTRFPRWVTVAYLWDRREQYKSSSGTYAAFDELIGHFSARDHIKAWRHGELDDLKKNALRCIKHAKKEEG